MKILYFWHYQITLQNNIIKDLPCTNFELLQFTFTIKKNNYIFHLQLSTGYNKILAHN